MAINSRDNFPSAGIAHTFSDTVARERDALITGDSPPVSAIDFPVAGGQTLAGLNVVGLNGSGRIVPATFLPGAQPGVHASSTVTVGTATTAVTIDGQEYNVSEGNAAARAAALADLINADPDGAAYATHAGATLSVVARGAGTTGNVITLTETGNGNAAAATLGGGTGGIVPIGILAEQITTAAGVHSSAGVYVSGVFNPDRLVWHESFAGDAARKLAFMYSPAGTGIIMRKIRAATVT